LTRLKRPEEALDAFRRAAELDADNTRYAYVYAVALNSAGRGGDAMTVLNENLIKHPNDRDTLSGLTAFSRDAGNSELALSYAQRLQDLMPSDRELARLIQDLRRRIAPPTTTTTPAAPPGP
jgi:Flp pilus assembly protein TadD